jgi:uncharacterized membrane protein YphA (DoxX/SURF4 family)
MLDPAFGYLITAAIALLFASAGAHKFQDLARFAQAFAAYRVLPEALARRLAWLIPSLELCVAASLLLGPSRRMAVVAAIAVLIAYALALGFNLHRGRRDLDCGCGTARGRRAIAAWMVWRNLILAGALAITALPWSSRTFNLIDLLTITGGLAGGVTLYAAVDRLLGDVAPKAMILRSTS